MALSKCSRTALIFCSVTIRTNREEPPARIIVGTLREAQTIEDALIANEVRRRYVDRIKYLGEQRGKVRPADHLDHELAIYSELLGVQHALGGPSGWFPS